MSGWLLQKFPWGIFVGPRLWHLPDLLTFIWKYFFLNNTDAFKDFRYLFKEISGWMFEFSFVK